MGREAVSKTGVHMYTGRMIEQLVESVQRAEQNAQSSRIEMALKKAVRNAAGYSTYIYEAVQRITGAVA